MISLIAPLRRLSLVLALLVATVPARADVAVAPIPQYRLKTGQVLTYRGSSDVRSKGRLLHWSSECTFWVVRANADGSWRLLFRSGRIGTVTLDGKRAGDTGWVEEPIGYFDLFPDGRIPPNTSIGVRFDPSPVFPKLPANEDDARRGWQATDERQDSRTEFTWSGPCKEPDRWVFEGVPRSYLGRLHGSSSSARYVFDTNRGVVARVETKGTEPLEVVREETGVDELASIEQLGTQEMRSLADQSERYLAANRTYRALLTEVTRNARRADELLPRAERTLKDARESLTISFVRKQIDDDLRKHPDKASYSLEEAKQRAAILDHSVADWEAKDLDGNVHTLKDYRGKVVILDFWDRGCVWCIRAMPQVKGLAEEFKDKPVAVLGMSTDAKEQDARIVADEMKLNHPVLRAQPLYKEYHLQASPTLIILDQEGKIADVHIGYTHTLREDVGRAVRKLLDQKGSG